MLKTELIEKNKICLIYFVHPLIVDNLYSYKIIYSKYIT